MADAIGKPDSFDCEAIEVGRLVKAAPITPDVSPAEVTDEKEHHVGLAGFCGRNVAGDEPQDD